MTPKSKPTMTPKQEQFVREYLIDLNATQAAIRAGYSAKTAYSQGERLLKNDEIAAAIEAAKTERSEETKIDAAWVLKRLAEEAQADMADLYTETGAIKPVHEWPLIWRQGLVAGIKHQELRDSEGNRTGEFIIDVKVSDRVRRLELIGKHVAVKAFEEQVNVTGLDALADRLARAAKRAGD
ncbi:terminase small subunit [Mesorhizobium sp.]|uniref:terminase small subunit n=1 Tax=Mesorhizobium sp. TaxID=1871066 RepID=UPI00121C847C|nr:terminase small subunit [Mesorhizobium sp.]TIN82237.1 MAG: terminase small subunit [Mesorhizobium sp.]